MSCKIVVVVRTYNEEKFLSAFIDAYVDWVDYILVQDDWSDKPEYLFDLPKKVLVSFYTGERIERNEITRAKQHLQMNSLIHWAEHLDADWIISDDCDCVPNPALIQAGREILETCDKSFIYAPRLYLYKDKGHFPDLSFRDGNYLRGIWAWRAGQGFRFINNGDGPQKFSSPKSDEIFHLPTPPYALLHSPWTDDEIIAEKRFRYSQIYGKEYLSFDPLKIGGRLEKLPAWAVEVRNN